MDSGQKASEIRLEGVASKLKSSWSTKSSLSTGQARAASPESGSLEHAVDYHLPLGEESVYLNDWVGKKVRLSYCGTIHCSACGKAIKKSYSQGYCFPCSQRLARCDLCIVRPETCHYHLGTCREPEWGLAQCFQSHIVYLSNASGLKVGITRESQIPTRWIDQGAKQAIPLFRAPNRRIAGLIEQRMKANLADKTNWRKMLKDDVELLDMEAERQRVLSRVEADKAELERSEQVTLAVIAEPEVRIHYPVNAYPNKVVSHNFDKQKAIDSVLMGIKGQYLLFESGVINIRKFTGYQLAWQS